MDRLQQLRDTPSNLPFRSRDAFYNDRQPDNNETLLDTPHSLGPGRKPRPKPKPKPRRRPRPRPRRQANLVHVDAETVESVQQVDKDPPCTQTPKPSAPNGPPMPKSVLTEVSLSTHNLFRKSSSRPGPRIPPAAFKPVGPTPQAMSKSVSGARTDMHKLLADCRKFFIACELTRMRKARVGSKAFFAFLDKNYEMGLSECIVRKMAARVPIVTELFNSTVKKMCALTRECDRRVEAAMSAEEVNRLWDEMCDRGQIYCEKRRLRVLDIFEQLRLDYESATVEISDAEHDNVKRDVFGLDAEGNYDANEPGSEVQLDPAGTDHIQQQPDLTRRSGFSEDFQSAIAQASGALREGRTDPTEYHRFDVCSSEGSIAEWQFD